MRVSRYGVSFVALLVLLAMQGCTAGSMDDGTETGNPTEVLTQDGGDNSEAPKANLRRMLAAICDQELSEAQSIYNEISPNGSVPCWLEIVEFVTQNQEVCQYVAEHWTRADFIAFLSWVRSQPQCQDPSPREDLDKVKLKIEAGQKEGVELISKPTKTQQKDSDPARDDNGKDLSILDR